MSEKKENKKQEKMLKKEAKKEELAKLTLEEKNKRNYRIRRKIIIAVLIVLVLVLSVLVRGNYLELKDMGENYLNTFLRRSIYTFSSLILNFVFLYAMFYFTHRKTHRLLKLFFDDEKKEMPNFPKKSASFCIALIGSFVATAFLLQQALMCFSNSWFGIKDPVFNIDIGYFVFIKPFVKTLLLYFMIVILATIIYAILYSLIILNKSFDGVSKETLDKCNLIKVIGPKVNVIAILMGLFVLIAMATNIGNEKFMSIELTDGNLYSLYGASQADATVKLVGYVILAFLVSFSIIKAYGAVKKSSTKRVIGYVLVVPVYLMTLAIVLAIYSGITGSTYLERNDKYIKANIALTKDAYSLNANYKTIDYSGTITTDELGSNSNILNNMPIVNSEKVIQEAKTTQTVKGYYTFRNTQVEMYNLDKKPTLCYITPREISNNNASYSNKTYQYTHGYGTLVTLAGSTDENGYLINYDKGFGDMTDEKISISQPRIYYGLETNDAAVINSAKSEFDYVDTVDTNKDVEYAYTGETGLKLNFIDRLILGIKEGNLKLATSLSMKKDSRILTNRNILKRVKIAMPYLSYDDNPYMVVNNKGELYWVIDAYTTSNEVPFSQKYEGPNYSQINYIKNSCKVIVNAYTGDMKFYITDRTDPIIMGYNNVYPGLFEDKESTIPEDISSHFVYPKYLFNIQADFAAIYHNMESEVLYRGNDIWEISDTSYTNASDNHIEPYYAMIKDNNGKDTLGIIVPYATYDKQNITAYMVGYMDGSNMVLNVNSFNSDNSVPGLLQLESQINQDETIASEVASLSISGTKITRKMYAIPVDDTIVYIEAIYQDIINESNQKPTLKKVIIASGNKIAIGDTAEEARNNFVSKAIDIDIINTDDKDALINEIIKTKNNVKNSSRNNDWKLYGEDMEKLTKLLDQLESTVKKEEENKIAENAVKASQEANQTANEAVENVNE